ncbi:MAG: sigma-54-dependent Fis family transcriptional regulator [Rhodocyclaceae bacterium]|nr:sigma-54-dependent Fis family transcriptional regulator [Rhodocyclaceae bacterium]
MSDRVLVVEDDAALRSALVAALGSGGYAVVEAAGGAAALSVLRDGPVSLVLTDIQMAPMDGYALLGEIKRHWPQTPVVMMTAYGDIARAVQAVRDGASHYLTKPFEVDVLLAEVARFKRSLGEESAHGVTTPGLRDLYALAERVAASEATVLINGESGVGKEVLARFIHARSPRATKPFVAINCAAIPDNLLESTLFGHEKGAFTGATAAHAGKFEQADGGTLLLDEVSELPLPLQAKLLRALQEREVERVGASRPLRVDIRVLATSNRDMAALVAAGGFREDLYYRLNVFPFTVPPLRERPGDVLLLANELLRRHEARAALAPCAEAALCAHDWPGNVRELANVMQRAAILAPGLEVRAEHLLLPAAAPRAVPSGDIRSLEREAVLAALAATAGNRKRAAERLGMPERTLRHKLARWRDEGLVGDDL